MIVKGTLYRCPVCGAEVTVVCGGKGAFSPVCCNLPMIRRKAPVHVYHCDVCGSEVAVLLGEERRMELICCNRPMKLVTGSAAA